MTPEEFLTIITSFNPADLKQANDYLDKLPGMPPDFQDDLCRLYKTVKQYEGGKHLEITERLANFCAEREHPLS